MIDIENEVFDTIATVLRAAHDPISVYGEYVKSPAVFPAVMIEEKSNSALKEHKIAKLRKSSSVMYEVNVYSNKQTGKRVNVKLYLLSLTLSFKRSSQEQQRTYSKFRRCHHLQNGW